MTARSSPKSLIPVSSTAVAKAGEPVADVLRTTEGARHAWHLPPDRMAEAAEGGHHREHRLVGDVVADKQRDACANGAIFISSHTATPLLKLAGLIPITALPHSISSFSPEARSRMAAILFLISGLRSGAKR